MMYCHHCSGRRIHCSHTMEHPDGSSERLRWKSFLKKGCQLYPFIDPNKNATFLCKLQQFICECTSPVSYWLLKKDLPTEFLAISGMYGVHLLHREETQKNCNSFKHTTYLLSSQSNPKENIVRKNSTTKWRFCSWSVLYLLWDTRVILIERLSTCLKVDKDESYFTK